MKNIKDLQLGVTDNKENTSEQALEVLLITVKTYRK